MTTERSCAVEGIELCLDAASVERDLRGFLAAPSMEEPAKARLVDAAQRRWKDVKKRLTNLEACGLTLIDQRRLEDIDNNMATLNPNSEHIREDGPFIAQQISRLLRFEVLTSAGRASRS